jgi:glycine dehydrogenase subunit 1
MKYTQLTDAQVRHMLDTIGAKSVEELFAPVPVEHRLKEPLKLPKGVSELDVLRDIRELAARNQDCSDLVCFLGGGAYDHFIPSVVDAMAHQSEFVTAYTPYQAEASQGVLQTFYEFQTMVCELTGMEVANASLYEGASAAAEAMIMAMGITKRTKVAVAESVHPDTLQVLRTYTAERGVEVVMLPASEGQTDQSALKKTLDDAVAGVVIQSPNFYGCLERLDQVIPVIHGGGALAVIAMDPIASGLVKAPGALGADIVIAEGQPLGIPLQYGGPYLGLMATREKYLRKMPGRVVGVARDAIGRRGFCLALQTREQHIKRERATSNVCTNQGLLAARAAVYMSAMGKCGMQQVASQCFDKAHYAAGQIAKLPGYLLRFDAPFFKEFTVQTKHPVPKVMAACRERGILGGIPLAKFDERYADCLLVAVTEKRTKEEIDGLVEALKSV